MAQARSQRALHRRRRDGSDHASRPGLDVDGEVGGSTRSRQRPDSSISRASLRLKQTRADLTTGEAEKLGIRQQISTFTTEMGPSSSNRIHNIQLMANYIDGTMIRPGETFSFNDSVGPRTAERGFREGQMIIGSLLLPAIGGGVCQTATTLFNNAFELGLPILERAQPQLLHLALPDGTRRDRLLGRARFRVPERPEDRDPDQDELHELDAHLQLLRHESRTGVSSPRPASAGELALAADDIRARPLRAARLGAHGVRLEPVRLRRHRHPEGVRAAAS